MTGRDSSTDDDHQGTREGPLRLRPLRVLVVSPDERFRAVGAMLIARRGCEIFTAPAADRLTEEIGRERIDVVVLEGDLEWAEMSVASASLAGFSPPAGLVAVAEEAGQSLCGRPQLAKWGPFHELFAAIEDAELRRGPPRVKGASAWPPAEGRQSSGV